MARLSQIQACSDLDRLIRYPSDTEFSSWEWLFSQLCWLPLHGVAVVVDV